MNKQRNKYIAIIIFIFFILPLFNFENVNAVEPKSILIFELEYESNKKISILFLIGENINLTEVSREDIIKSVEDKSLWNKILANYTLKYRESNAIENLVIGKLNTSFKDFMDKILGVQNNTLIVKRLEKIQYATAMGIEIEAINLQTTLTIYPLKFIFDNKYNINTYIKITIGYDTSMSIKFDQKKFTTSHYRALLSETIEYYQISNEITIIENPSLSPSFLFIFLIICTIVCTSLTYDASRRNEKVNISVLPWVFGFIFYFLAFIPYSNFLVYVIAIIGIIIAGDRFRKGILFGKKIKRDRYHHTIGKDAKISAKTLLSDKEFQPEKVISYDVKTQAIASIDDTDLIYEKLNEYGDSYFAISPSSLEIYKELGRYAEDIYISGVLEEDFIEEGEEITLYEKVEKKKK